MRPQKRAAGGSPVSAFHSFAIVLLLSSFLVGAEGCTCTTEYPKCITSGEHDGWCQSRQVVTLAGSVEILMKGAVQDLFPSA